MKDNTNNRDPLVAREFYIELPRNPTLNRLYRAASEPGKFRGFVTAISPVAAVGFFVAHTYNPESREEIFNELERVSERDIGRYAQPHDDLVYGEVLGDDPRCELPTD